MSNIGSNPGGETPPESRRTSAARLGLSVNLEPGEREAIQTDPEGYIRQRYLEGDATVQIADKLEAGGADRRLAQSVVAALEKDTAAVSERKQGTGSRTRNTLISVICGVAVYVAVVAVLAVAGGQWASLLVQIPALALAVVLGRVLYSKLKGGKDPTESGQGPKVDRNEKARRLSR